MRLFKTGEFKDGMRFKRANGEHVVQVTVADTGEVEEFVFDSEREADMCSARVMTSILNAR